MTAHSSLGLVVHVALLVAASAMEVYTPSELQAKNGTDARLKCTFSSAVPLSDELSVSWTFRPLLGGNEETVFYFLREPYPPNKGRFANRAFWDGNTKRSDGSIIIRNIQPTDNGTYLCQIKNPPDIHGEVGEIMVSVVDQVKFSEIMLLMLVIGVGSAVIIVIVIVVVLVRYYRKQRTHSTAVSVMECKEKLNDKSYDVTA